MLQLTGTLLNRPVMSLRTGTQVAVITDPIINPNNLKIEGFYCDEPSSKTPKILLYQDIRDVIPQGLVVDDVDALSDPAELVRLKGLLELKFDLLGMQVRTTSKQKVGKISDYAVESSTMYIQKLYASQSIFKNFTGTSLSIDRNQIQEITDKYIIINDLLKSVPAAAPLTAG